MSLLALLNRTCDIWGVAAGNPEVEDSPVEAENVVFPGVPCRVDSVLYSRRSTEVASSGGAQNVKRATIFLQDPRLRYPENFDENNWIVEGGLEYKILIIDEVDDMFSMHHYEIQCEVGRFR
jgi:hypothetical protein